MLNILLILLLRCDLVISDCGFPALPESAKINLYKNRYNENSSVQYECYDKHKELIGGKTIECLNGKWEGNIPKCANVLDVTLRRISRTDMITQKPVYAESKYIYWDSECWKPVFTWNLTRSQKWEIEIKVNSRIDYFSLIFYGKDLIESYLNGNFTINATMWPHKHCDIEMFDLYQNDSKTRISFSCYSVSDEILITKDVSDPVTAILFDVQLKQLHIPINLCTLKAYSLSDSCGTPEKPLHSVELSKEKSFVIFSCEEDFNLEPMSNQQIICGQLGKWDKSFPKCVPKSYCPFPLPNQINSYLHINYKNLDYINGTPIAETNSIAVYSCHGVNGTKLELKGEAQRICKHGFWSGSQPKCVVAHHHANTTNQNNYHKQTNQATWNIYLVIALMLVSFIIGVSFIGFIIYLIMKYVIKKKTRIQIPSVVISEPNNYYEGNPYEQYVYESIRLSEIDSDLERINSLYQTSNNLQQDTSQKFH